MPNIMASVKLFALSVWSHGIARDSWQWPVYVLPMIAAAQGNWATLPLGFPFFPMSFPVFHGHHGMAAKVVLARRTRE